MAEKKDIISKSWQGNTFSPVGNHQIKQLQVKKKANYNNLVLIILEIGDIFFAVLSNNMKKRVQGKVYSDIFSFYQQVLKTPLLHFNTRTPAVC